MAAFTNMHAVCWIQIFRSYFHTHLKPWVDSFSPFVIHNKEGATFVHGALKNASQDTHTHSFPSPCSPPPPNSPSLSLPSIWISCHLDTLRVNMDACMCAKVTYFSSQHNIIKSWVHPPLLLVYCLALRFCWLCVCMCVYVCFGVHYWCVLERQVFFGVVMHVHKCVCVWDRTPLSSHYGESGWPNPGLTSVSESGGAPHRASERPERRGCFYLNTKATAPHLALLLATDL